MDRKPQALNKLTERKGKNGRGHEQMLFQGSCQLSANRGCLTPDGHDAWQHRRSGKSCELRQRQRSNTRNCTTFSRKVLLSAL